MDQVFVVRHKVLVEKKSVRRVAREMGISRLTVKRYVGGAPPGVRASPPREKPVSDAVRARVVAILEDAPRWTGGKQRLTTRRLHRMLRDEGVSVGEWVVKQLVREWRRRRVEIFVPLTYKAGDLAEVDFFQVLVDIAGARIAAWMFVLRLMFSGRDFAWLYPRQDQVCFLDGHVRAFEHLGVAPNRVLYDNLRPAVARVLVGSERDLQARFLALATHYVVEPCFARPATGHDKGGVEARGKGIRWQELVPIPSGPDLRTVSSALLARLDARMAERADGRSDTIAALFAIERERMLPLPRAPFVAAVMREATPTRRCLIRVDGAYYSVWSEWYGRDVRAYVGVDDVTIVGPDARRVVHPRQRFGGKSVDYRHYLPELAKKPQAVRQVVDELLRDLGAPYDALWRSLVDEQGPKQAARVFARVLGAVVERGDADVAECVRAALTTGEPILLALRPRTAPPPLVPVETLPASLASVDVTAGRAADYDALLGGGR
jgi:transposase